MKGFKFAGIASGIKKKGFKDLGLIYCDKPVSAAALFTKNKVVAAPVILGKEMIKKGRCQAVLVNSGNANCFTGLKGMEDAKACVSLVSETFDIPEDLVLVSSTGVIGAPLPMDRFETGIPKLKKAADTGGLKHFAEAILTTDTCEKIVERQGVIETARGEKSFSVKGVAKGSGMIRPDMATMLAYVVTDVEIDSSDLKQVLICANEKSFNRISVDGDTSTNDTLVCLASGTSGVQVTNGESRTAFQTVLDQVCRDLAKMIVKDGEGATKTASILVKGAKTKQDAFKAAEAVAHSNLVKTALFGQDPNWGRITAAAGRSGAHVEAEKMDLYFDNIALVLQGQWQGADAEKEAALVMEKDEISIVLNLNLGKYSENFLFCDFSENYVKINADYRS